MMLMFTLTIAVMVAAVGCLPVWRHRRNWGFYPIGGVSVVILFILILLFAGEFRRALIGAVLQSFARREAED